MTLTTKVMRTQTSIKNQHAAAVFLIKIYFYDYTTWCSEFRVQFVITVIVTVTWCMFATRQHKDSSVNFAETALY